MTTRFAIMFYCTGALGAVIIGALLAVAVKLLHG